MSAPVLALLAWLLGALGFFGILLGGSANDARPPSFAGLARGAAMWPLLFLAGLVTTVLWATGRWTPRRGERS